MSTHEQIIQADLTYVGDAFVSGVQVVVDAGGRILRVGALGATPSLVLRDRALLPGMINAHSHAFQRGMRGLGEVFPREKMRDNSGARGDFWSWREAMYRLVLDMNVDRMYDLSRAAYEEMLAAGITTVGEFHYLHHDADADTWALDEPLLAAARDAGIRLVVLYAYYRTGGIGQPLSPAQRRFHTASPSEYWRRVDRVTALLDPDTQTIGAVAHSVRAASLDDLAEIHAESKRRRMPFHMHVEEQVREIQDCRAAYDMTPMRAVLSRVKVDDRFTSVHCTHTDPADMSEYLAAGGRVCLCPLTEANLGDGVADVPHILDRAGCVAIGSDLNSRLCMPEELRLVEYAQRLIRQRRGIVADEGGRVGSPLFRMATLHGAESLGAPAGVIEPDRLADFFTLDLTCPTLAGWTAETLLETFIFGAGNEAVGEVCVGGRWRR
ncbi:MAG: Atrazine chlorohydrolase [Phycisphaerae bacterium]|nr:Atrazine chlorohydrolase [Phycisphaerae bacterium]